MKKINFLLLVLSSVIFLTLESCGPVVFSSRLGTPPPPWFYPNRIETVRYIYFPDYEIYYDLSLRNYIYFDNNVWLTVDVLPTRFNSYNLRRSKQVRIHNYFGDNIKRYHNENRRNINRRSSVNRRR